jgi:hypothetical protein
MLPQASGNSQGYTPGASTLLAPARALRQHGADMVLACSCVPGAADGNPLAYYLHAYGMVPSWLAETLTQWTPLGRISDAVVGSAFLNQHASRATAGDAHFYFESNSNPLALLETFAFHEAQRLVGAAEREMRQSPSLSGGLLEATKLWDRFRSSPRLQRPPEPQLRTVSPRDSRGTAS